MRLLDTRHWNIVAPVALLAVTACGPDPLSLDGEDDGETGDGDGETGDGDGETGDGDGDGDGDEGPEPECVTDSDCPSEYYCTPNGYCEYEYWCGQPLPHHPGSVAGDPVHPACSPPYECYSEFDCGPGFECISGYCEAKDGLELCVDPGLVEIPLPADATGPVLDLAFANLDADPAAELILLAAEDLVIVDDDLQSVHLGPFPPAGDQLTALRVDEDEHVDLLITDSQTGSGVVWLGSGALELSSLPGGPATPVVHPTAIDWSPGGPQELLAASPDGTGAMVITALTLPQPPFDPINPSWGVIDDVAVGHFFEPGDNIVTSENCAVVVHSPGNEAQVIETFGIIYHCTIAVAQLDDGGVDEVVSLTNVQGDTTILVLRNLEQTEQHVLPGAYTDLAALDLEGDSLDEIVLIGEDWPEIVRFAPDEGGCRRDLPDLPGASKIAAGDFDGDGTDEFVLLDG